MRLFLFALPKGVKMDHYIYEGPVKQFDTVILRDWSGKTYAPSEKKARANLIYQFKKQYNKSQSAKITLCGEVKLVERKENVS